MPFFLWCDVLSAEALVWIGSRGQRSQLTSDAHRFFFDRYVRLAEHYSAGGKPGKARACEARAAEHGILDEDGPPYAAAMAMPRPSHFLKVHAVSGRSSWGPDDAA